RPRARTAARGGAARPPRPGISEAGGPASPGFWSRAGVPPAGTPAVIVGKLNGAINESLRSPEVASTLVKLSVEARITSPEEFARFLARERDKWTTVVKTAGVQME